MLFLRANVIQGASMKKTLLTSTLVFCSAMTVAQTQHSYVIFHYNIHSDGKNWSDDQCMAMLGDPLYYNIVNDKPIFQNTAHLSNISYQRLSTTYIDKTHRLFTGKGNFTFESKPYTANTSFALDMTQAMTRGTETVPGVCSSNFIGLQQHQNNWPITPHA